MMTIGWTTDAVARPTLPAQRETPQLRMFHQAGNVALVSPLSVAPDAAASGTPGRIGDDMPHHAVWRQYERLLQRRRDSQDTIHLYDVALHLLWTDLQHRGIRWDRVIPEDVEDWLQRGRCKSGKRNAGLPWSPGTRNVYGRAAKAFYTEATAQGWLQGGNPLRDWKPPPRPGVRPRALPVSAIGLLLREVAEDQRLTMIVALGFHQGLRIGEICRLSVGDLDLHAEVPQIYVKGKGGREKWMDLSPVLVPALRAWLVHLASWHQRKPWTLGEQTPLIPNYRYPTEHLSPRYGARLLAAAMRPVVGDSGHALRGSGATQLARVTKDPYLVQQFLRHASLDMQAFYVATNAGLLAAALAQLPDPLQEGSR